MGPISAQANFLANGLVFGGKVRPTWWPDLPPNVDPVAFREMWLRLQSQLTTLSTESRQVFADHSSHFVNFDQPEVIVAAVRQMIDRVRMPSAAP